MKSGMLTNFFFNFFVRNKIFFWKLKNVAEFWLMFIDLNAQKYSKNDAKIYFLLESGILEEKVKVKEYP